MSLYQCLYFDKLAKYSFNIPSMFKITRFLFIVLSILSFNIQSQNAVCGTDNYMRNLAQNQAELERINELRNRVKIDYENNNQQRFSNSLNNTLVVPVAFHFPNGTETDRACLETQALSQIDALNTNYAATNSDISLWENVDQFYPGVNPSSLDVYFCLATQNHPTDLAGNPINSGFSEGEPAITIGYNFGNGTNRDFNWAGYLNIIVKYAGDNINGYSPIAAPISQGYGIVLSPGVIGTEDGCPDSGVSSNGNGPNYSYGEVAVHEIGHFFGLAHTFSDSCDVDDDNIADTPNYVGPTYGCSQAGTVYACDISQRALTMNHMDYNNDDCAYMFTQGQTNYMQSYLNQVQSNWRPNSTICDPTAPSFNLTDLTSDNQTCSDSTVLEVDYTPINGFDEVTTLTVSCDDTDFLNSNASLSLVNNTISTAGVIQINATNLSNVPSGSYDILLTATSNSVSISKDIELTIGVCGSMGSELMDYEFSTTGVVFNTISNLNNGMPASYSDYSNISTEVVPGNSYDLSVYVNSDGQYRVVTKVWIDWNQDCIFEEDSFTATEEYFLGRAAGVTNGLTSASPYTVTVPADAVPGTTTMRVSTKYSNPNAMEYAAPCGEGFDGEVEDYTINVADILNIVDIQNSNWSVFPNPTQSILHIKADSFDLPNSYIIYNMLGQEIATKTVNTEQDLSVEVEDYAKGVYIIKLFQKDKFISLPFVKR